MVITRYTPIHALLYLVVSFLAVAMIFFVIGRTICFRTGSDRLCRRHYRIVHFCRHDAKPGQGYRHAGKTMATTKSVDMAINSCNDIVSRDDPITGKRK